jgi:N-acetyl-gamma-glutamyl-phosphate reductase
MMHTKRVNTLPHNPTDTVSENTSKTTSVSVVGARGYAGLELCRLLLKHPAVKLTHCYATGDFTLADSLFEDAAKGVVCLKDSELLATITDVVFLATPAEVSLKLVPQILAAGKKVIDLSGAFRLKKNDYKAWYHFDHSAPEALAQANYGLLPFAGPVPAGCKLIANPGCYATAISLALIPLLKKDLVSLEGLVIDAKSGTSGAGKKAAENLLFAEVAENCGPYRVGKHQHLPEVQEACAQFGSNERGQGPTIAPHFATSLLPVKRGIIAAIYATAKTSDLQEVENAYAEAFKDEKLVRFGRDVAKWTSLSAVSGTPFTHISYELIGNKLYVFSVIDNLLKGAASQAVENLNRFLDLPTSFSLKEG